MKFLGLCCIFLWASALCSAEYQGHPTIEEEINERKKQEVHEVFSSLGKYPSLQEDQRSMNMATNYRIKTIMPKYFYAEPSPEVRKEAVAVLREIPSNDSIDVLEKAFSTEPVEDVKIAMAEAIEKLKKQKVQFYLSSSDRDARITGIRLMRALPYKDFSLETLVNCLRFDQSPSARIEAIEAIEKLGDENAIPQLKQTIREDPNMMVREEACKAIKKLSQ